MFEYTLDNGKRKFKNGLICLIFAIAFGVIMSLFLLIDTPSAQIAVTIVFSILIGALSVFGIVYTIFGAVVYHAERTATKSIEQLNDDLLKHEQTTKQKKN